MSYTPEYRRILSRMGYYNYQNGLIYRHLSQDGEWDDHLAHCRNYILSAIEKMRPVKVTILGSGWLLDLPLAEIIERSGKVVLVDIVHPPEVIRQVKQLGNVELIEADVTGGLVAEVWNKAGKNLFFRKLKSVSEITVPEYNPDFDPGLIISLNLLTQLDSLPVEFLRKRSSSGEAELNSFRAEVQQRHITFLTRFRSVLISDVEEIFTEKVGGKKVVPSLLARLPEGNCREEWTWNFDTKGGDYYNSRSVMRVVAMTFNL